MIPLRNLELDSGNECVVLKDYSDEIDSAIEVWWPVSKTRMLAMSYCPYNRPHSNVYTATIPHFLRKLEQMLEEGWVATKCDPTLPRFIDIIEKMDGWVKNEIEKEED